MLTVSSGVHWFDQDAFYAEPRRVLTPGGLLVLYEHMFLGVMVGREDFSAYHLTQSNTVDPVERGAETVDEVRTWLTETLAPFFADADVADFEFFGRIDWWSPTAS